MLTLHLIQNMQKIYGAFSIFLSLYVLIQAAYFSFCVKEYVRNNAETSKMKNRDINMPTKVKWIIYDRLMTSLTLHYFVQRAGGLPWCYFFLSNTFSVCVSIHLFLKIKHWILREEMRSFISNYLLKHTYRTQIESSVTYASSITSFICM